MKLRESGMPEETYWESLFDIPLILDRLEIDAGVGDVVELGCGYGTFTLAIAERIGGRVLTFDIDRSMVERTRERALAEGVDNVVCVERDVVAAGYGLAEASVDGCVLFNILHCDDPMGRLTDAAGVVRAGGWVWAIHWRWDSATPRGPSMTIRPKPEEIAEWAERTAVLERVGQVIDLPPWHYGWRFRKRERGGAE